MLFDYPQNWDEIRKMVYRKDRWTCKRCGARNAKLHAHHLVPLSEGGSDEIENLITLCEVCHKDMHFGIKYGGVLGLLGIGNIFLIVINPMLFFLGALIIVIIVVIGVSETSNARKELIEQFYKNNET